MGKTSDEQRLVEDRSCGIVPYRVTEAGRREFLLVQHKAGHWSFPKGHPEEGESPIKTARRELLEETGLKVAELIESPCFEEAYVFVKRKSGRRVLKRVMYFVARVEDGRAKPQVGEIAALIWGDESSTRSRLTFAEGRDLFDHVLAFLDSA